MTTNEKRCSNCRFFVRSGTFQHPWPGVCREDSPQVVVMHRVLQAHASLQGHPGQQMVEEYIDGAFPGTHSQLWCGKWQQGAEQIEQPAEAQEGVSMTVPKVTLQS